MSVSGKQFLACALLLTIAHSNSAEYNVDGFCTLVRDGTKFASTESCQSYYVCQRGRGTLEKCDPLQSFDKNSQNCRSSENVDCYYGNDKPCQGKVNGFVPVVGTCNGYIYCEKSAEVGRGQCGRGLIFVNGECVYGDCPAGGQEPNSGSGLQSVCQIMPDAIYFGSTMDCTKWQMCFKGKLSGGHCPKEFVFDVQQANCNYESDKMCSRVTGIPIQPDDDIPQPCLKSEQGTIKPDTSRCSTYYKCNGKKWNKHQCQAGLFFDQTKQICLGRETAKTTKNCDRCEGTRKSFVNAVDPHCQKYFRCEKGVRTSAGTCDYDKYFDESAQACIYDDIGKQDYANKNGACFSDGEAEEECVLNEDNCECTNPSADPCECGFDSGDCIKCEHGVGDDGECLEPPAAEVCNGNIKDCKCNDPNEKSCDCGVEDGECIECPNGADKNQKCKPPPPVDVCNGNVKDCKCNDPNEKSCDCGVEDGECIECPNGADKNQKCKPPPAKEVCNGVVDDCKCNDPQPDPCNCGVQNAKCIECPNGADEAHVCIA